MEGKKGESKKGLKWLGKLNVVMQIPRVFTSNDAAVHGIGGITHTVYLVNGDSYSTRKVRHTHCVHSMTLLPY